MARGMSGKFLSSCCALSTRDEAPIVTQPSVRFVCVLCWAALGRAAARVPWEERGGPVGCPSAF